MENQPFHINKYINHDLSSDIDFILLKRNKRAFRFVVLSVLALTMGLWFSDRYLRFDLSETKYRIALTLEKESARPIMRNIINQYSNNLQLQEDHRYLTYLEFLAFIEEGEEILRNYEKASILNPNNQSLLINYACRLYLAGEYENARKQLQKASTLPPNNALPNYLESAILIETDTIQEDKLYECLSLIAKTNRSHFSVIMPTPFWHNTLPENTYAFYNIKKKNSEICLAPLYRFYSDILSLVKENYSLKRINNKKLILTWLEELYTLSKRLIPQKQTNETYPVIFIAPLSLKIRKDILHTYLLVKNEIYSHKLEEEISLKKIDKINNLLNKFTSLEELRRKEFEKNRSLRIRYLFTIFSGFLELSFIYIIVKMLALFYKLINKKIQFTNLSTLQVLFITSWNIIIYLFVTYITIKNINIYELKEFNLMYYFFIIAPVFFLLKSFYQKRFNEKLRHNILSTLDSVLSIHIGIYCVVICLWFITFRIVYTSYPYQLNLVNDNFIFEELKLFEELLSL